MNRLCGFSVHALDGAIGAVDECLFDDRLWTIRYLVANIGGWLTGQLVLIPSAALRTIDGVGQALGVALTQAQVADCPDISTDEPVSHQMAASRIRTNSGLPYWGTSGVWGLGICPGDPGAIARLLESTQRASTPARRGDPHLHSTRAVPGYGMQACDGAIGYVADFIIDDTVWAIRYIVIASRSWWPGRKVLVPARWINSIDCSQSRVTVDAPREVVRCGPAFDQSALADPAYETWLQRTYARLHR
jgi:hypothetical protein